MSIRGKHWAHTFCPHPLNTCDQEGCQDEVHCGEWERISGPWGRGVYRLCVDIGMGEKYYCSVELTSSLFYVLKYSAKKWNDLSEVTELNGRASIEP